MSRLATGLWVSAYLARLQAEGISVYIVARGDATAGAVLVKLATMDGKATAFQRSVDLITGERRWMELTSGDEPMVDESIRKQRSFDPDLWVIEVEDARGRHMLGDMGLD
ncbi:DUF1491 family protein [Maritimibacter sp. DP1N21-5]|uniref:DUF1491 family protein n=1 Tax=Maritimibacter sp. DP1N21-5 TaxID=2836867 RepID=UPI001C47D6AA|nr:DUF1491 family protein [Maritimibacter sp. DP1N21-5]